MLDERERHVFIMQVLSAKEDQMTLDQLGAKWNVSRERIRQIRNYASKRVANEVKRKFDELGLEARDVF